MKKDDIHRLIDRYFDAELSRAEEDVLFDALLAREGEDGTVDAALAVMLLARSSGLGTTAADDAVAGHPRRKSAFAANVRGWSVAAVAAALAVVAVTALVGGFSRRVGVMPGGMVAYVGGVRVEDQSEIMKIVDNQLDDIGICSDFLMQEVSADLEDIRQALNNDGL